MSDNDEVKRLQVVMSAKAYDELKQALKARKLSMSNFARDAIQAHYLQLFGETINLDAGIADWGGAREGGGRPSQDKLE